MAVPDLAIIIPAYKDEFLDETLRSLCNQTVKDFSVYIGDDNSPYGLKDIVDKYADQLNLTYRRFDSNLGKDDLVAHWNRCLEIMEGETYFCLFSDDDLMTPSCVETFYEAVRTIDADVFHFNIDLIDVNNQLLKRCNAYPPVLTIDDFLYRLYTDKIDARMPEFVFRTEHFRRTGGFVNFDIAYRADNATVIRCAMRSGIHTLPAGKVLWRDSGQNLSATMEVAIHIRRVCASADFFNWLEGYYESIHRECPLSDNQRLCLLFAEILALSRYLGRIQLLHILKKIRVKTVLYRYFAVYLLLMPNLKHRNINALRSRLFDDGNERESNNHITKQ